MATIASTPSHARFGSSLSGSTMAPPFYTADAPSMADSLPSINFGFEDLRERMARFTARFDDFIEKGRKRVLEERNQFRLSVAEIQEQQRTRKCEIEDVANKSIVHQNTLTKEQQELEEMEEAIAELKAQRQENEARRDDLRAQISEVQKAIHVRRQAQQQHQRQLDDQARHNGPELSFWESNLCMRIDKGGRDDTLKFVFTHIDERKWERECWFELSMGRRDYSVNETEPQLEREAVDEILARLNETREMAGFLKAMRSLFSDALKH